MGALVHNRRSALGAIASPRRQLLQCHPILKGRSAFPSRRPLQPLHEPAPALACTASGGTALGASTSTRGVSPAAASSGSPPSPSLTAPPHVPFPTTAAFPTTKGQPPTSSSRLSGATDDSVHAGQDGSSYAREGVSGVGPGMALPGTRGRWLPSGAGRRRGTTDASGHWVIPTAAEPLLNQRSADTGRTSLASSHSGGRGSSATEASAVNTDHQPQQQQRPNDGRRSPSLYARSLYPQRSGPGRGDGPAGQLQGPALDELLSRARDIETLQASVLIRGSSLVVPYQSVYPIWRNRA